MILGVIIITPLTSFAISYDNTSIRLTETPQFCYYTDNITLQTVSFIALHQWEKSLILDDPHKKWGMDIKHIGTLNWNECNVIIQFIDNTDNPRDLGKTDLNEKEALISIALYNEGKKLPIGDVSNALLHELGHSMGLGHYDSGVLNDSDSIMSPQFEIFENIKLAITPIDINKMNEIYLEGFK